MSKGKFRTPRSLGSVEEIRTAAVKIRFNIEHPISGVSGREISANYIEGTDVSGDFEEGKSGNLRVHEDDLATPDIVMLDNFIKMLLAKYTNAKGYSNVTIL